MKPDLAIGFESVNVSTTEVAKKLIRFFQKRGDIIGKFYYEMIKNLYREDDEFEPLETSDKYSREEILSNIEKNNSGQFGCYISKEFDNENCYVSVFEDLKNYCTTFFQIFANTSNGNLAHFIEKNDKWMNIQEVYLLFINISKFIHSNFFIGAPIGQIPFKHISFKNFCNGNVELTFPYLIGFDANLKGKEQIIQNWKLKFKTILAEITIDGFYIIHGYPMYTPVE